MWRFNPMRKGLVRGLVGVFRGEAPRDVSRITVGATVTRMQFLGAAATLPKRPGALHDTSRLPSIMARHYSSPSSMKRLQPFLLPQTGEGIAEMELIQWFVQAGEPVEMFQDMCEVQSDKATVMITSRYQGVVRNIHYVPGDVVKVGAKLVDIEVEDDSPQEEDMEPAPATGTNGTKNGVAAAAAARGKLSGTEGERLLSLATPAVRRVAREEGVDLGAVAGSGPGGRVLKGDVLEYVAGKEGGAVSAATPPHNTTAALTAAVPEEGDRVEPVRGYQRIMVKTMTAALAVPHFGYQDEVEMGALVALRDALRGDPALGDTKLTYLPLLVKAASIALRGFPAMNASMAADGGSVIFKASHNVGVAMDTPTGLVVPVVHGVQSKSITEVAAELARLHMAAQQGRLAPADVTGGTITVSNIGSIGGTYASPILNLPEAAIVALGRVRTLPRFGSDGSVRAAPIMNVSWAADHRLVDGATLAGFCNAWKELIENPSKILLHMR